MSSPSAPPVNGSPRPRGGLTFRAPAVEDESPATWAGEPTRTTETSTTGPLEETTPGPADPLDGSPSDSEWSSTAADEDDESDPRSSRASSADGAAVRPLTKRAQQLAARQAVVIASGVAHQFLARTEEAQAVGLYLADEDDAERIGDPLARIVGRRAGSAGAVANPDVADGISAMLGMAGFIAKQISKTQQIAQHRAAADAGPVDV
jgi:hypothetical protein